MHLKSVQLHLVQRSEEPRFLDLMQAHHYLGSLPKIGETLWYVATYLGELENGDPFVQIDPIPVDPGQALDGDAAAVRVFGIAKGHAQLRTNLFLKDSA